MQYFFYIFLCNIHNYQTSRRQITINRCGYFRISAERIKRFFYLLSIKKDFTNNLSITKKTVVFLVQTPELSSGGAFVCSAFQRFNNIAVLVVCGGAVLFFYFFEIFKAQGRRQSPPL